MSRLGDLYMIIKFVREHLGMSPTDYRQQSLDEGYVK